MIRISKLADYAVVILSEMAHASDDLCSASHLAQITNLSEPTVSKILKLLTRGNVIESVRGVNGGYKLSHPPKEITIADVITAIDGPIALVACADDAVPDCTLSQSCALRGRWDDVNAAVRGALMDVTLVDMMQNNKEKECA